MKKFLVISIVLAIALTVMGGALAQGHPWGNLAVSIATELEALNQPFSTVITYNKENWTFNVLKSNFKELEVLAPTAKQYFDYKEAIIGVVQLDGNKISVLTRAEKIVYELKEEGLKRDDAGYSDNHFVAVTTYDLKGAQCAVVVTDKSNASAASPGIEVWRMTSSAFGIDASCGQVKGRLNNEQYDVAQRIVNLFMHRAIMPEATASA